MVPSPSFCSGFSNFSEGLSLSRLKDCDIEAEAASNKGARLTAEGIVGDAVAVMGTPAAGKLTATDDMVRLIGWN